MLGKFKEEKPNPDYESISPLVRHEPDDEDDYQEPTEYRSSDRNPYGTYHIAIIGIGNNTSFLIKSKGKFKVKKAIKKAQATMGDEFRDLYKDRRAIKKALEDFGYVVEIKQEK